MQIRLATPDDLSTILELSNFYARTTHSNFAVEPETAAAWRESFDETALMHPWLVAEGEGRQFIGFAKSSPWKGRCAYDWSAEVTVYVHADHHGEGVGRALYTRLINILRAQGYRTALGGIAQPNEPSVRLHESIGFRKVAQFERIGYKFGRWWDVGYWESILDTSGAPPKRIIPVQQAIIELESQPNPRTSRR